MSFFSKLINLIKNDSDFSADPPKQQHVNIHGYNSRATLYKMDTLEEIQSIPVPTAPFELRCDFTESIEYVLQRKATQFKRAGDMDCAIACLQKALEIIPFSPMTYTDVNSRLEKYLRIARRFSEADSIKSSEPVNNDITKHIKTSSVLSLSEMSDMIEVTASPRICGECAKYQKRIYAKGGKKGFPDMKIFIDYLNHKTCDCNLAFYTFFYGTDPTFTKASNAVRYSNRPFIDDRTSSEKQEYNNYITKQKTANKDRQDYNWIWEHLPDIAPKSYGGYRNMKNQNSKNYQKLVAVAKEHGYII